MSTFSYLGIAFSSGGSFSIAQKTLARQAQKAIFKLNYYLIEFSDVTPKHTLDLFDKLVSPILIHTSNAKCFRNVSLINIRGLADIIVPVRGYGRH